MDTAAREANPGAIAAVVGAITGLPSMAWAAMQGDWLPAYAGSATGIGCAIYSIWQQGENRRIRMQAEAMSAMTLEIAGLRGDLKEARDAADLADQKAIEERRKLRVEIEELKVQNARLATMTRRVETIVSSPTSTPDPDAKGGTDAVR